MPTNDGLDTFRWMLFTRFLIPFGLLVLVLGIARLAIENFADWFFDLFRRRRK